MKKKIEKELKGLSKSFSVAFRGIKSCIYTERNMRIHLTVTVFVLIFSMFYDFTPVKFCILLIAISSVITAEILNTAIEEIVDMHASSYSGAAKTAKDLAAGGVLVSAIFSSVIGVVMFWDYDVFIKIIEFFAGTPLALLGMIMLAVIGILFIFKGLPKN